MFRILFLGVLFFSSVSNAANFRGNVSSFYINSTNTALLIMKQDNTGNKPNCTKVAGGWDFKFATDSEYGKQWVSMLLAARMSNEEIVAGYSSNPDGSCTVSYFYFG